MTDNKSTMVTDFAEFYRCIGTDGTRYYAASPAKRTDAIDYNGGQIPPTVRGYAVYDTTQTMSYAVAIYPTKAEAEAHEGVAAPTAPKTIFEDEPEIEDFDELEDDEIEEDDIEFEEDEN
jgi:hypothetical protein